MGSIVGEQEGSSLREQSVKTFLEAKKEFEMGVLKLKLIELYLSDPGRIEFYRTVERILTQELMKVDSVPDKYLTAFGNFKGRTGTI